MEEDDDVNGTLNKILINDSFSWTLLKFTQVNAEGGRACTHMAWFSILTPAPAAASWASWRQLGFVIKIVSVYNHLK